MAWDILVLTVSISPHQKQYNSKEEAENEWTSQVGVVHDCMVCLLNRVQYCQRLGKGWGGGGGGEGGMGGGGGLERERGEGGRRRVGKGERGEEEVKRWRRGRGEGEEGRRENETSCVHLWCMYITANSISTCTQTHTNTHTHTHRCWC